MTIDQTTETDCVHNWVNARCANCAVVSSERRLREFLEHSSGDYEAMHGLVGPNGNFDVDLVRAMVSTLLNLADYLEERDKRRNPVGRLIDWVDWPLRAASSLTLLEKMLRAFGLSLRRESSPARQRSKSHS